LDNEAKDLIGRRINEKFEMNGMNYHEMRYYDVISLYAENAETIFSECYDKEKFYNYDEEPKNNDAGKFIVRHRIFIIICLEILETVLRIS